MLKLKGYNYVVVADYPDGWRKEELLTSEVELTKDQIREQGQLLHGNDTKLIGFYKKEY